MRILKSGKEIQITDEEFLNKINSYNKVIIDLGTGQGSFVYFNALENKDCFYIGLDSCRESMKKYAIKQFKNKVENLIYVIMNAQNIDKVLGNKCSEVYINLPWGSLLQGIFNEDLGIINSISKIAKSGCKINICFSYDEKFEKNEIEKRALPELNEEYFENQFKHIYNKHNIVIENIEYIVKDKLTFISKWMKVLTESKSRKFYIINGYKR